MTSRPRALSAGQIGHPRRLAVRHRRRHCSRYSLQEGLIRPMATRRNCSRSEMKQERTRPRRNRRPPHARGEARRSSPPRPRPPPRYPLAPPLPSRPRRRPRPLSRSTAGCSGCALCSPPFSPYVFPALVPCLTTRTLLTRTHEQLSAFSAASAKQIVVTVGGNTTTNTSAVFQPAQITNATIGDTIFFNCEFSSRVFVGSEEGRECLSRR